MKTQWIVKDIPSQHGKTIIVTGANSGIGWEAALALARSGGNVILAVRSAEKGKEAVARIINQIPTANVRFELLDLASLRSVHAFADKMNKEAKLDILVNNAGVMSVPQREVTEDGFERQFGTNYMGPFALTGLLMPVLRRAPSPRVVVVSSAAANMGMKKIDFDDLQLEKSYAPWKAYCQSKLADLLFSQELARRSKAAGINLLSVAAHPGYARTNLQTTGSNTTEIFFMNIVGSVISQDAAHGALPTLRAAVEKDAPQGSYYAPSRMFHLKGDPVRISIPSPAQDIEAAKRLWEVSEKLTGVHFSLIG
jgi:NAD(P)-dependent dehydrogenase (short-subunit alcohol dehydrogenase family)